MQGFWQGLHAQKPHRQLYGLRRGSLRGLLQVCESELKTWFYPASDDLQSFNEICGDTNGILYDIMQ